MSLDVLAAYVAAGRSLSPWLDRAVWFALWVLPGIGLIIGLLAAWAGLAVTCRGLHRLSARITSRRNRWTIHDLENYANQPTHPRFTNIPARKEDTR